MVEEKGNSFQNTVVRHRYEIPHPDENKIVSHEIFGIGPGPFLSLFGEEGEKLGKENYPMFGAIMGCPDTGSVRDVADSFESNDVRFYIYFLSFKKFCDDYFNENNYMRPFLVYLHDFSFDNWNRFNLDDLVERLNNRDISVTKILAGDIDVDGNEICHAVLLFKKGNGTVLD